MYIANTGFWDGKDAHLHHGYSKPLVNWIIDYLKDQKEKQLYDFGCGIGQYLQKFQESGFQKLTGFEGDVPVKKVFDNIKQQDLTKSFSLLEQGNCIWLEVAEHIPEQYIDIAIQNVFNACNNKLIMSWAVRGQGGHGHVNCLDNYEAIAKMTKFGFKYLEEDTLFARKASEGDLPWFVNTILIFQKI